MAFITLEKTKIINSSLYEQKNHFSYPVSVADDGNFSLSLRRKQTTYTFRFVPQKDMFYVPLNGK